MSKVAWIHAERPVAIVPFTPCLLLEIWICSDYFLEAGCYRKDKGCDRWQHLRTIGLSFTNSWDTPKGGVLDIVWFVLVTIALAIIVYTWYSTTREAAC